MNRALRRLVGLSAAVLLLAVAPACNEVDDPGNAEAAILVTSVTTEGLSTACCLDATATVGYKINPRNESVSGFYHDITLTSYTVEFEPAVVAPMSGVISTGFCPMGGSCSVTVVVVPAGSKPGAGTTVVAHIDFDGEDINDNPVSFSAIVPMTFTP